MRGAHIPPSHRLLGNSDESLGWRVPVHSSAWGLRRDRSLCLQAALYWRWSGCACVLGLPLGFARVRLLSISISWRWRRNHVLNRTSLANGCRTTTVAVPFCLFCWFGVMSSRWVGLYHYWRMPSNQSWCFFPAVINPATQITEKEEEVCDPVALLQNVVVRLWPCCLGFWTALSW